MITIPIVNELKDGEVRDFLLGEDTHKKLLRLAELDAIDKEKGVLTDEELNEFFTLVRTLAYRLTQQYYEECDADTVIRNLLRMDEINK